MEPVEVTVRFDAKGKVYPLRFVWSGRAIEVTSTGRRWQDQAGQHILVMSVEAKTYELVFDPNELRWYLNPSGASPKIALSS